MTKEERKLRKFIRGCWDGSMIKISKKGEPDKFENTDTATLEMITIMRRAVIAQERERCAKYIEMNGRGKCVSDDSAKALANETRRQS